MIGVLSPARRTYTIIFQPEIFDLEAKFFFYFASVDARSFFKILDLAAFGADEVDVWAQIGFVPIVLGLKIHDFNQPHSGECLQGIIDCGQAHPRKIFLRCQEDLLRTRVCVCRGQVIQNRLPLPGNTITSFAKRFFHFLSCLDDFQGPPLPS